MEVEYGSNYRIPHSSAFAFPMELSFRESVTSARSFGTLIIPAGREEQGICARVATRNLLRLNFLRPQAERESAVVLVLNAQGSLASAECSTVPASPRSLCYPPA